MLYAAFALEGRIRPKHRLKGEPSLRRADCRNPRIRRGAPALAQGTSFGISRHIGARETPGRCEYFLTDKGQALGPVLKALYEDGGKRYG